MILLRTLAPEAAILDMDKQLYPTLFYVMMFTFLRAMNWYAETAL